MSFNIFGPASKDSIRVGYISTDRGFIEDVTICEANEYAKLNPGTQFIFKTRSTIDYLNINEVNALTPDDALPDSGQCEGIQLESECGNPEVYFYGGGGVGVQGNPVFGEDGSLLAVDLVSGGFGYQYSPIVEVKDNCGVGAGAVTRAVLGEIVETVEYYDQESDFEQYELCEPADNGYGIRYGVDGKEFSSWDPTLYANLSPDPIRNEIEKYQNFLKELENPWWSTRKRAPLRVTSANRTTRVSHDVRHPSWGGEYITTTEEFKEVSFKVFRSGGKGENLALKFTSEDKTHSFKIKARDYKNNTSGENVVIKVKTNTVYTVTSEGVLNGEGTERGLISSLGKNAEEKNPTKSKDTKKGNKIFADFLSSSNDNDDLQVEATQGEFTAKRVFAGTKRSTFDLKYQLSQSASTTSRIDDSFMNSYAISPVPPSDVPGSDFAGIMHTFEWEENFPYDGEYIFRGLCDNKAEFYLDNIKISDLRGFNDSPEVIKKTISEGVHRIRLDLLNIPIREDVRVEQNVVGGNKGQSNLKLKFIQRDGNYFLEATGEGTAEALIVMEVNDTAFIAGLAATEVIIPSESEKLKFKRTNSDVQIGSLIGVPKTETIKKRGKFVAGKTYGPIQIIGATPGAGTPKVSNNKLGLLDADGTDENIKIIIADIKNGSASKQSIVTTSTSSQNLKIKNIFNTIDYISKANRTLWRTFPSVGKDGDFLQQYGITPFNPNTTEANTDSFEGVHTINWTNVNFPIDGNYIIELMVDDNVTVTITGEQGETTIRKRGFSAPSKSTGKSIETKYFKSGNYTIRADLEQIKGKTLAQGNPMALAINISPAVVEENIISAKSWNENPMGVALTIEAPMPPIPQEPIPPQEGRCPRNPIWSTRFPNAKEKWWPVKNNLWNKFFNRYAISPIPPLDSPGSDGGGVLYKNSWDIDIPYDGFYSFQVQRDETARIYLDNQLAFDVRTAGDDFWKDLRNQIKTQKTFISKGRHTISLELENRKTETYELIDKKIFSTSDWVVQPTLENKASDIKCKFIRKGNDIYLEALGNGQAQIEIVMEVNDAPFIAGLAAREVIIPSDSGRLQFKRTNSTENYGLDIGIPRTETIRKKGKFTAGNKYGPIQIIGATPGAGVPKVTNNKIGLLDADGTDENIKIIILDSKTSTTASVLTGGLTSGSAKDGVSYSGPVLASYKSGSLGPFLTPAFTNDEDYRENNMGRSWKSIWSNVEFPEDGRYELRAEADDEVIVRVDGEEIGRASVFEGVRNYTFNASKGRKTIELEFRNIPGGSRSTFNTNPVVFNAVITKKVSVASGISKSWEENPIGIAAVLVPPPCPKLIRGKGVVTDVIVDDPGNGYPRPNPSDTTYPVTIRLKDVIVEDTGINYSCGVDQIQITPNNGAVLDYVCDTFGRIIEVKVLNPGIGFTRYPEITLPSNTGINASFRPQFEVIRDPIVLPEKLIQVTDLVGLKQTGYVDGRPYYGSVFYKEGVRYAGFYETAGELVQVYDTLQESIDGRVTTPASAILRQGTDVSSNDPRLNIPGTPENLI